MKAKWLAALAAVSLTAAPVAAETLRASAPVPAGSSKTGGESFVPWAILVGILAGTAFAIIQEEDNDDEEPASAG